MMRLRDFLWALWEVGREGLTDVWPYWPTFSDVSADEPDIFIDTVTHVGKNVVRFSSIRNQSSGGQLIEIDELIDLTPHLDCRVSEYVPVKGTPYSINFERFAEQLAQ